MVDKRGKSQRRTRRKATSGSVPVRPPKRAKRRNRHQNTDFERLLREAENRGWSVTRDKGYFKCRCPCAERHYVGIVLTPSSSRTLTNTRRRFERLSCWDST